MPNEMVENIIKNVFLYTKKIYFFVALNDFLKTKNIDFHIELTLQHPDGNDKIPDFLILNDSYTILEHKSTLPQNEEHLLELIHDTYTKYSSLIYENKTTNPNVIILCPKTGIETLEKIKNRIEDNVTILIFNLDIEHEKIIITKFYGDTTDNRLKQFLEDGWEISFKITDYSGYKFLRKDEPHEVYTAIILWLNILPTFLDAVTIRKESYQVTYDKLLEQMKTFYPKWIRDVDQISKGRVNKALKFLNKIGFVKWENEGKPIQVFTRGVRVGDLESYFAEKWVKTLSKEEVKKTLPKGQTSLDDIPKYKTSILMEKSTK